MAGKKQTPERKQYEELKAQIDAASATLKAQIDGVKKDNITQYGEIKKDLGAVGGKLESHNKRLRDLETDKTKREAVAEYLKEHPDAKPQAISDNQDSNKVNKELMKVILQLIAAIGVLAGAIIVLRSK